MSRYPEKEIQRKLLFPVFSWFLSIWNGNLPPQCQIKNESTIVSQYDHVYSRHSSFVE